MALREQLYTNEAFWEFVEHPENADKNFELMNGALVEMPSPSPLHGVIAAKILFFIMLYLADHDIGYAVGDANDFDMAPGIILKPDAAFISKARLPDLPKHFELAPDLAVEVVSPSNTPTEILDKVETYIHYGAQLVWVVYPAERVVHVYRPAEENSLNLRKLIASDTLDGGEVLVGFGVQVGQIFPES